MKACVGLTALLLLATFEGAGARADTAQSPLRAPPLQPWQVRREQLDHTITGARQNDPAAMQQLDPILTELEQHPLGRTPIEVLDIVGSYYVPNEGIDSSLSVIVTQLVLGWYDVLRYASRSGARKLPPTSSSSNERWCCRVRM